MRVEEQNVITLTYRLYADGPQGELLEQMDAHYPFTFLFGTGKLLPAFEAQLQGLQEHESFAFRLLPEEAYGPVRLDNIVGVPLSIFHDAAGRPREDLLVRGNYVALTDDQGETHNGKVIDWDDEQVTIDFNHAMAGMALYFEGTILHIRSATVDELIRRHYIQEDGLRGPEEDPDDWWKR